MNHVLLYPDNVDDQTSPKKNGVIKLPEQIQHLQKVLKVNVNDTIKIALLGGQLGTARVQALTPEKITLTDITQDKAPPKKLPITLVVAMPRPKALRRLIMDAVTMGVKEIILIHSYRVEKSYWQSPFLHKLDDYIRLGLEQSGDSIAPNISLKKRFKPFVEDDLTALIQQQTQQKKGQNHHIHALVAHPNAEISLQTYRQSHIKAQSIKAQSIKESTHNKNAHHEWLFVIGAEGGFIPYEVDLLKKNGCQAVSLGERILRTETAISQIVGVIAHGFNF